MAQTLWVMITAMVIAMLVMLLAARPIGDFVNRHPTMKILALSFLLLIGVMLVAESLGNTSRRATFTLPWPSPRDRVPQHAHAEEGGGS